MADGFTFDASELSKLAQDLGDTPKNVGKFVRQAVEVTARHVKDSWRDRLQGSSTVPFGPSTISYDVDTHGHQINAEVGPVLGKSQATIVGILEVGTPTTGPRGFGLAALKDNVEDFERGLARAINDALDEGNV